MKPAFVSVWMVILLLVFCATNNKQLETAKTSGGSPPILPGSKEKAVPSPVVMDSVIQLSAGGGVTGQVVGCEISSRGRFRVFTRNAAGKLIRESQRTLPIDTVRHVFRELYDTGIFQHPVHTRGNMTYYFIYRDPKRTFSISWTNEAEVPEAFWQWFIYYRTRCQEWVNRVSQ